MSQVRRLSPWFSDEEDEALRGQAAHLGSWRGGGEEEGQGQHPQPTPLTAERVCPLELSEEPSCQNQRGNSSMGERRGRLGLPVSELA